MTVNILAVGDVCGKTGIDFLYQNLASIKKMKDIAFTVVNGENANIVGITPAQAENIFSAGADVITLGNHTWARWEIKEYLDSNNRILRPANYALGCPGFGHSTYKTPFGDIAVISLIGRFTLDSNTDNPFYVADEIIHSLGTKMILVDMHAEATSEKAAMGFYLDGRVSAVWGTHTHVQTSDACVLPKGTGFITDLGMSGPALSILGIDPAQSVEKFLGQPPRRYESAEGPGKIECAVFTLDTETGHCLNVEAMRIK
jgi:2',3'-cyclic-nucleotide 2'-phosphodiesterase